MRDIEKIIKNINQQLKLKKLLFICCFLVLIISFLSFLFVWFNFNSKAIKFIANNKAKLAEADKIMTNPRIKFEYEDGKIFNIQAKKAIHKDNNDVELSNITANGDQGSIEAGKLLITDNGNNLYFSESPVLTIIQEN